MKKKKRITNRTVWKQNRKKECKKKILRKIAKMKTNQK